jgi:tRNA(Ile)-lysidine synthase
MSTRRKDLPSRVLETCRGRGLLRDGDHVLVAVSGGADSLVLLDCLCRIRGALDLRLAVGHVDHGLRPGSAADAEAVLAHAAALGLPAFATRVDVAAAVREGGRTVEEAGRELRTAALAAMARRRRLRVVATGHTATDQAETVLMRLVRGTGPLGLAGIDPARRDGFVRPLLCATRDEVRRYARAARLPVREDETNRDERHLRNRVRLKLLPLLRRMNPRIEAALAALADDAAGLDTFVSGLAGDRVEAVRGGSLVPAVAIVSCPPVLLPYVVRHAFSVAVGPEPALSRTHIDALARLATTGRGEVLLPRGVVGTVDADGLRLRVRGNRGN